MMDKPTAAKLREDVIAMLDSRPIVLIGLMGAGKSTIGRRLAQRLNLPFVDADNEIEKASGKTIPEIFEDHGEAHFRDGERRVIARLLESGQLVIATGGGAFMNEETRANVLDRAISVWLRADLPLLMKRVRRRSHRPLLRTADPDAVMQKLMDDRYPVYAEANVIVDSRDVPHNAIVSDVITALAKLNCEN
jgi:shikimate kinase